MSLLDRIANAFKGIQDPSRKKKKVPRRVDNEPAVKNAAVRPSAAAEQPVPAVKEEIVPTLEEQSGEYVAVRRDQSFSARMALSDDELRGYYNQIKGALMNYGVRATVAWRGELFRTGFNKLCEIRVRGKSVYVYFALDPEKVPAKYRGENVGKTKAFVDMPFCYVVNGERKCAWCCELCEMVCEKFGAVKKEVPAQDWAAAYPKDTEDNLVNKMLIKEIITRSATPPKGWSPERKFDTESGIEIFRTDVLFREYASVSVGDLNVFADDDEVTLDALKAKKLVPETADAWRLLAGGELSRKLHVVTNYCPMQAAQQVKNAGGRVTVWKSTASYAKD